MTRKEARQRAEELVSQMTVEEAASQLRYDAPAIPRLGIPEYNWWNESLHGVARAGMATCFPQAIAMAATFDEELVKKIGQCNAKEARAKYNAYSAHGDRSRYKGVTMWAPNINIFRDPRWGRGQETFGEDPVLTARLGSAMVKGLQTKQDGYLTTAACAKHFAVHSGPEALRHEFNAEATEKDLWETYLPAFEACVKEAQVEAVMGAYNRTNGDPCCAHPRFMGDILREKWGFQGHYVSDCWAIRDFHEKHHITAEPEDSVTLALKNGCDLNCGCTYQRILNAYEQEKITEDDIKKCAVRIFTTRFMCGLFDKSKLDDIPYNVIACKKHLQLAYETAVESCVLLKNDGILPLATKGEKKYKRIVVMGPNADSRTALLGNYFGTPPRAITLLEGIQCMGEKYGMDVTYVEGSTLYKEPHPDRPHERYRTNEAVMAAENADLAILCVGLDSTIEGEQGDAGNDYASGDKPDLLLPRVQREMVERVLATGTPTIILNASGSAIDLSAYEEQARAIMQVWYPGGEGGKAVADILFGKAAPAGKLPVTFYYNTNTIPEMTDYHMTGRTYRYMTEKPWHGFGYGLTYGEYSLKNVGIVADKVMAKNVANKAIVEAVNKVSCSAIINYEQAAVEGVTIEVLCTNETNRKLSDVLQVYVHVEGSNNEVPNYKLATFKRIRTKAGEEQKIQLHIPARSFTTVNDDGERRADGTGATIYVGFSQPDEKNVQSLKKFTI